MRLRHRQAAIVEAGIREAVAEWIERLALVIFIRPVRHRIVAKVRQIID